jgi:hypothetical protein
MIQWHDIEQGSEEWFALRLGKATASNFGTIMANEGKAFGDPAIQYAQRIAIESVTEKQIETFANDWMQQGKDLEPVARQLYAEQRMLPIEDAGIFVSDCGRFASSPDGLIENGGIEIKSVKYNTHFTILEKGGFDTKYKWQITGQIWLAELDWVDWISYCPLFPENKQLYVFRVVRDEEMITRLQSRLEQFWELVTFYKNLLK